MTDILPCPFCAALSEELGLCYETGNTPQTGSDWFMRCYGCHVETVRTDTKSEAVATWNRRAPTASPRSPSATQDEPVLLSSIPQVGGDSSSISESGGDGFAASAGGEPSGLCSDCPPVGYPTEITRCGPCPRRMPLPEGPK